MTAYSMDLRERVLTDCDAGMRVEDVAAKYRVSRAWVHRLLQRRRETGAIGPRRQTKFRARRLSAEQEDHLRHLVIAQPDRTLVELREALPTSAGVGTIWRALARDPVAARHARVCVPR
jgi:transposase